MNDDFESGLDHRHKETAQKIAQEHFSGLKKAMKRDSKGSGINELQNAIEEALKEGLGYALDAEERAWLRVTQLEDALIELARHCPAGEIVRGRELAEGKIK